MRSPQNKFLVYRSSAGSGKTYSLVRQYLELALASSNPNYFRHILAITFTNKAALEMKNRVMDAIQGVAAHPTPEKYVSLFEDLLEELKLSGSELQARAVDCWRSILHNYSDLAITTIDAFTLRLIKSFSREMDLDPEFEVETDIDRLVAGTLEHLYLRVGIDKQLTKVLLQFLTSKMQEEKDWNIEKELIEAIKLTTQEKSRDVVRNLAKTSVKEIQELPNLIQSNIKKFEGNISLAAKTALDKFYSYGFADESFSGKYLTNYYKKIIGASCVPPTESLIKYVAWEKGNWCAVKNGKEMRALAESLHDVVAEDFDSVARQFESDDYFQYQLNTVLKSCWFNTAVLHELAQSSEKWKKDQSIVMISDFNAAISNIVQNNPVPFIYESLGEWYHHILIDEFQDTSILQWQNLIPLVDNALSKGKMNLIVGDAKQAIYRWRNGEVRQFVDLPEIYAPLSEHVRQMGVSLSREYEEIGMEHNWRSAPEIVEFNNKLFSDILEYKPDLMPYFRGHVQIPKKELPGYVTVQYIEGENKEDLQPLVIARAIDLVMDAIADNFEPNDIAVLLRTNGQCTEMASALIQCGIDVTSNEGLLIESNTSARFCMNYVAWLADDTSIETQARLLISWSQLCEKQAFLDTWFSKYVKSGKNSTEIRVVKFLADELPQIDLSWTRKLDSYECLEYLIATLNLAEKGGAYLEFLLEKVWSQPNKSIAAISSWWLAKNDRLSISIPENVKGVRVTTVHKSKGLEYPVVITPLGRTNYGSAEFWIKESGYESTIDGFYVPFKQKMAESGHPEFIEERNRIDLDALNVLYVANTRAIQRLHILFPKGRQGFTKGSVEAVFHEVLSANSSWTEDGHVAFGNRVKIEKKREISVPPPTFFNSNPAKANSAVKFSAPVEWQDKEAAAGNIVGNVLHILLSKKSAGFDVETLLRKLEKETTLNAEVKAAVAEHLQNLRDMPELNVFFEQGLAFTERDLLSSEGKVLRPDFVADMGDQLVILDYKTGEEKPAHHQQVAEYMEVLKAVERKQVKGYLVYTQKKSLVEVSTSSAQLEIEGLD